MTDFPNPLRISSGRATAKRTTLHQYQWAPSHRARLKKKTFLFCLKLSDASDESDVIRWFGGLGMGALPSVPVSGAGPGPWGSPPPMPPVVGQLGDLTIWRSKSLACWVLSISTAVVESRSPKRWNSCGRLTFGLAACSWLRLLLRVLVGCALQ